MGVDCNGVGLRAKVESVRPEVIGREMLHPSTTRVAPSSGVMTSLMRAYTQASACVPEPPAGQALDGRGRAGPSMLSETI